MKALRIHEFGGVDVLRWEEVDQPKPRAHQVLIKVDSAGVNYADVMRRQGGHSGGALPTTLEVWPESHWPGFALRQTDVL